MTNDRHSADTLGPSVDKAVRRLRSLSHSCWHLLEPDEVDVIEQAIDILQSLPDR